MSLELTPDTNSVLREIMPTPDIDQLRSHLAPVLAQVQAEYDTARTEETILRARLDEQLTAIKPLFEKLQKYSAAAHELDSLHTSSQNIPINQTIVG